MLDDILLEKDVGHSEYLALAIKLFLLQIIAIPAFEVAQRTAGFGKDLKIP
jgi:hypothetical protein